ncbi:hypothetical protein QF037_002230 [Streptomyces canus]|uniref:hypothetical protein n=1 Tax=Streptomyces canus TaxID=58343 RepID=UPI0027846717|nr:hypothetical protein [Streptomyces canus]MDQ0597885.1 hypothetical protein [Streptomyces canus]
MFRTTRVCKDPMVGPHAGDLLASDLYYAVPFIPVVTVIPPGTPLPGGDPPTAPRP